MDKPRTIFYSPLSLFIEYNKLLSYSPNLKIAYHVGHKCIQIRLLYSVHKGFKSNRYRNKCVTRRRRVGIETKVVRLMVSGEFSYISLYEK